MGEAVTIHDPPFMFFVEDDALGVEVVEVGCSQDWDLLVHPDWIGLETRVQGVEDRTLRADS